MEIVGGVLLLGALVLGVLLVGSLIQRDAPQPAPVRQTTRSAPSTRSTRAASGGNQRRSEADPLRLSYRTKDGRADYRFSYERQSDGTWRAYILSQPGYGSRDEGAHPTHRLSDGRRKYVCWSAPIPSLEQAKQVSALWADATQEYIRTGKRF